MSTTLSTMIRLRGIQNKMRQLVESLDETTCRTQFHPQLSPIGWHLGHCLYTENYWLHEIIQDNNKYTKKQKKIFSDNGLPIHKRGSKLPKLKKLLIQAQQQQDTNDLLLIEMIPPLSNHPLFENEYIQNYIIQHYAQHFEVMQIIMNQSGLSKTDDNFIPATPLTPDPIIKTIEQLPHGEYKIGGEPPFAYDNELPEHTVELDTCNISMQPVTNAEYLSFINDQGYQTPELWSNDAWQWLTNNNIKHPEYWRQNKNNDWYGINELGPFELTNSDFVYGISHYEASAFACWANARLPHENEWETCAKLERIKNSGQVWEWCSNTFEPYTNFTAFPEHAEETDFNQERYVLKGASQYTRPEIRRASFRNFYSPEKRHMFSGMRLVFE